ncbi:hypothetical protein R1T15_05870 [Mucilaginibacter sp. L3T2-6]|nr:hypothetical protein [Mucilaginibacter sp. L3T2-6]MDO3641229.1 hypothetical protein [Mucilaginibacter sp. L3T2-6]MDV6214012.1 hypothetical protein [Mucilaginibacter sp. L3T2-6]
MRILVKQTVYLKENIFGYQLFVIPFHNSTFQHIMSHQATVEWISEKFRYPLVIQLKAFFGQALANCLVIQQFFCFPRKGLAQQFAFLVDHQFTLTIHVHTIVTQRRTGRPVAAQ